MSLFKSYFPLNNLKLAKVPLDFKRFAFSKMQTGESKNSPMQGNEGGEKVISTSNISHNIAKTL